eukprot:9707552-Alexandrium_andersonii.AAC.1
MAKQGSNSSVAGDATTAASAEPPPPAAGQKRKGRKGALPTGAKTRYRRGCRKHLDITCFDLSQA